MAKTFDFSMKQGRQKGGQKHVSRTVPVPGLELSND